MILIPVIDLAAGRVVHARGGERSAYRPLQSGLCASSRPADVVGGLLSLHPFTHLYIADLDAITGSGDHYAVIGALQSAFPQLQLWVDAGVANRGDWLRQRSLCPGTPVAGSETLAGTDLFEAPGARDEVILSLDFRHRRPLGSRPLHERPGLWPRRLICMSLDRVGSGRGADMARLQQLRQRAPSAELYAAGGIAGAADLEQLQRLGVAGALLASALHEGGLDSAQLRRFAA